MSGYIEGVDRDQVTLFPEQLEDWIGDDHPARFVDHGNRLKIIDACL